MNELADHDLRQQWQGEPECDWRRLPPVWQEYAAQLHANLLRHWAGRLDPGSIVLKTDLFEEAMGVCHPCGWIRKLGWRPLGMDLGRGIARAAQRGGALQAGVGAVVCDVRRLPFGDGKLDAVFCNSTLDHFIRRESIDEALRELWRVLRPGGELALTMDNPWNPVVALRNALPRRSTRALGVTDFHVGPTLGVRAIHQRLVRFGFEVWKTGTMMHAQRYLALRGLRRCGASEGSILEGLLARERRGNWPTALLTGHFGYALARKPE